MLLLKPTSPGATTNVKEPSWYLPTPQNRHALTPVVAEYFPALQSTQVALFDAPDAAEYLPATQSVQAVAPLTIPIICRRMRIRRLQPLTAYWLPDCNNVPLPQLVAAEPGEESFPYIEFPFANTRQSVPHGYAAVTATAAASSGDSTQPPAGKAMYELWHPVDVAVGEVPSSVRYS